jgi:pimeloyl-ACP methyl ester carboxylesterase
MGSVIMLEQSEGRVSKILLGFALLSSIGLACNWPGFRPAVALTLDPESLQPAEAVTTTALPSIPPETPMPFPTASVPTTTYTPLFEPAPCRFAVPEGYSPQCGYLVVPEDRRLPNSPLIRLHVAIFKSWSDSPAPDPVIHLAGGPGSASLQIAWYYFNAGLNRFLESRDYIIFDQRGTGFSLPALHCPERDDLTVTLLTQQVSDEEAQALEIDAYTRCRDRLIGQGINLAAYNSAASAADVNDLRIALGYEQINLYGVSYGTRLALTVMRDYPTAIRSVILDSPYPPQVNLYTEWGGNAERAFNLLFDSCNADLACNTTYPNLREVFYQLVDQLRDNPILVTVNDPFGGGTYQVLVDDDLLIDVLFGGMYRRDVIPGLPALIYETYNGNYTRLARRLGLLFERTASAGMRNSVQCNEEIAFSSYQDVLTANADLQPQLRDHYNRYFETLFAVCDLWGAGQAAPIENQPVASDIPTLILAGQYDPITPPAWGQLASATLSRAWYAEFPGVGHWTMRSAACPLTVGLTFLNNPSVPPDLSCISSMAPLSFER